MASKKGAAGLPRTFVGTSGYSYKEWKGGFYPPDLPASGMLRYYAARFSTVEINNTFYHMPTPALLEKWLPQVPPDFTFVLKASQRITHRKRLKDTADDVSYFLNTAALLGDRLGPVLFQLPPFLRKDLPRLTDFLHLLPTSVRSAFEFRHESWFDDSVYAALQARGAALCVSDTDEESSPVVPTAGWGYLRLRRCDYTGADLERWRDTIFAQGWERAFVFFKHEDEGTGPKLAAEFIAVTAGAEVPD
jgi:uncharacterized protein YecE (DUF72 family)